MASAQGEMVIDLNHLSCDQLRQAKDQLDQELNVLNDSLAQIRSIISQFEGAGKALEKLAQQTEGKPVLVPLASSLYVPGSLTNVGKVLVDVGTGYYIEKSVDDGVNYCQRKAAFMKQNHDKVVDVIGKKQSAVEQVALTFQAKLAASARETTQRKAITMFGASSNPFGGQSSSSPLGISSSSSAFATSTAANPFAQAANPFAAKPFGPTSGQTSGQSTLFGGTSTGVFGAASQPAFGATTPAFGSSMPAFGYSTPAVGSSTPTFGSSTPAFGSSTPAFGSSTPAFGSSMPAFGSSAPAFGSSAPALTSSTPAFGPSTPAFGSSMPAFGSSTPAFGSSMPAFGSTPASPYGTANAFGQQKPGTLFGGLGASTGQPNQFGSTTFGQTQASQPAFGTTATPAFGTSGPAFGAATAPAFGSSSTPLFGATTTAAFGVGTSSTPAFGAGQTSASTSAFGATAFGTAGGFGQQQQRGSRTIPYQATNDPDSPAGQPGKFMSISAMPAYKNKSDEELRWEDYQQNDKGGPAPPGQAARPTSSILGTPAQSNPFGSVTNIGSTMPNPTPFGTAPSSNPSTLAFGSSTTPVLGATSSSAFGSTSSASLFGSNISGFGTGGQQSSPAFALQPVFHSAPASTLGFSTTNLFGATSGSALGSNMFGPTNSCFGTSGGVSGPAASSTPLFGRPLFPAASPSFATSSTPASTNIFANTSPVFSFNQTTGSSGLIMPTPSSSPSLPGGFSSQATNASFSFNTQPQATAGFLGSTTQLLFQQPAQQLQQSQQAGMLGQQMGAVLPPVASPFGYMPALPQVNLGKSRITTPTSGHAGIASMPVLEKPTQSHGTSLLTPRHITPRSRVRMHARRYQPQSGSPRVSFLGDGDDIPSPPRADMQFVPRENPRALFIRQPDQSTSLGTPSRMAGLRSRAVATPAANDVSNLALVEYDAEEAHTRAGVPCANGLGHTQVDLQSCGQGVIGEKGGDGTSAVPKHGLGANDEINGNGYAPLFGGGRGEAASSSRGDSGIDIEALLPKLRDPEYYTEPKAQELAAKERANPGYMSCVKDFVVGRRGYGSLKFLGETDVRGLDLEGIVQLNNCEVLVYMDESQKPAVGKGLNKPAEVTLLNVKCIDKKSGQVLQGPDVEKFERKLKRKTEQQGAEFVKYDASKGEWVFRVEHFSRYGLGSSSNVDDVDAGLSSM
ncbi:hypothetical protein CBR_g19844 [Chara braunii]|uniref:Nucleoporin autopeptidase n=1 Tax=Chara braunii TaxID=69332 RepID=A0A388KYV9_CHABU|nr:hypothetical protein CBR_g19844 [Chara braunii]|eukprot:GBG75208.1 hypothetical protein CBR_g19844 [Chara braunii]